MIPDLPPIIHSAWCTKNVLYPILASFFGLFLAGFSKSSSQSSQATTQQQVGGQGGGAGSNTTVAGAQSQGAGAGSETSHVLQGSTVGGSHNTINVVSSDPTVTESAQIGRAH